MGLSMYVVDAFTSRQFGGNSAAVIPLESWLPTELMQSIAAENNLSETAFFVSTDANRYHIRWFSPLSEIAFCGHATLASAFILYNEQGCSGRITFDTRQVGTLTVERMPSGRIEMDFPNRQPLPLHIMPLELQDGLSIRPQAVLVSDQAFFAVYASEDDITALRPDTDILKKLAPRDVVVTAPSHRYDFVSRYFWPANGGVEDPVTGSIHAGLAPYWAERLGKRELVAYQASARGGILYCSVEGERVKVSGDAVLYLRGNIQVA